MATQMQKKPVDGQDDEMGRLPPVPPPQVGPTGQVQAPQQQTMAPQVAHETNTAQQPASPAPPVSQVAPPQATSTAMLPNVPPPDISFNPQTVTHNADMVQGFPDIFTPGATALKERLSLQKEDSLRGLKEQMAARGTLGSSAETWTQGGGLDIERRMNSDYSTGLQNLAGQQAQLQLAYKDLASNEAYRNRALDLQQQGLTEQQALARAAQEFMLGENGYQNRALQQSGNIANNDQLLRTFELLMMAMGNQNINADELGQITNGLGMESQVPTTPPVPDEIAPYGYLHGNPVNDAMRRWLQGKKAQVQQQ